MDNEVKGKKKFKIAFNSPVILGFVIICFFVTLLGTVTGGRSTMLLFMTYGGRWQDPLTYIRLFTHVLGHSGWDHYVGNMMYILLVGPLLEEKYGAKTLLEVMGVTAITTGLINNIIFPNTGLCGASGVVFAFILMASFTSFKEGEIPLTFILVGVIYIGQQVLQGLLVLDNISNMAHIVGGLVGSVIGYSLNRK